MPCSSCDERRRRQRPSVERYRFTVIHRDGTERDFGAGGDALAKAQEYQATQPGSKIVSSDRPVVSAQFDVVDRYGTVMAGPFSTSGEAALAAGELGGFVRRKP